MDAQRIAAVGYLGRHRLLIALVATLWAAPPVPVRIDAQVSDDLRCVAGELRLPSAFDASVVQPLDALARPPDDLTLLWTYPGAPDDGDATLEALGPGSWRFETCLPRRFGDAGHTRKGLMANGWWHPVLLTVDGPLPTEWSVSVTIPEGTVGVLGPVVAHDHLSWSGEGDRVSLAVMPHGVTEALSDSVTVVGHRRIPARTRRELERIVAASDVPLSGTVVIGPLRRRLARDGVNTVFVSDRAFRLTPPLPPFHRTGVARSLYAGLSGIPTDLERDIVGAWSATSASERLSAASARQTLGIFSWIPTIDFILYDRTLPFYGDVFATPTPTDPIGDDLSEALWPHRPGSAVVAQVSEHYGNAAADTLARGLLDGLAAAPAGVRAGVSARLATGWSTAMPAQDYRLDVLPDAVVVEREAPVGAPPDVVVVRQGDEQTSRVMPSGPGTWVMPRNGARRIRLDPRSLTEQTSRLGDSYPQPFRVTVSGGVSQINLTEGWVSGGAGAFLRRRGDNRNTASLSVATGRDAWLVAGLGYTHRFGPELSGLSRRHRVFGSVSTALQNQRFADEDDPPVTLSAGAGWAWSNRQSGLFPLRGWRLGVSTSVGTAVSRDQGWLSARGSATRLVPLHPRLVWATRVGVGIARSDIRGRLLSLGGRAAVGGIPYGGAFGTHLASVTTELRAAVLRNLSVPMLVLWGTELELSAGVELGTLATDDGAEHALGGTFGIAGIGDIFGAKPYLLGFTLGVPAWWTDGVDPGNGVQLTVRWTQDF